MTTKKPRTRKPIPGLDKHLEDLAHVESVTPGGPKERKPPWPAPARSGRGKRPKPGGKPVPVGGRVPRGGGGGGSGGGLVGGS